MAVFDFMKQINMAGGNETLESIFPTFYGGNFTSKKSSEVAIVDSFESAYHYGHFYYLGNGEIDESRGAITGFHHYNNWTGKTVSFVSGVNIELPTLFGNNFANDPSAFLKYLFGSSDIISGSIYGDVLYGYSGDDRFRGGMGNDIIDGGVGYDTLILSGTFSQYRFTQRSINGEIIVADLIAGRDSQDTVLGIEAFAFSDGTRTLAEVTTQDTSSPNIVSFNPTDEATNVAVSSNITVTFSETIVRGIGTIVLKTAAGVTVATYDAATSSNLSFDNSTLTINPTTDLAVGTGYTVEFTPGSIKDLAGNWYAGTYSYNFTTDPGDITRPTVTIFNPTDEATGVAVNSNIVVTFSETIVRGIGNIVLKTAAGLTVATYDAATSSNLSLSNSTLTLNPTTDLASGTGYTVEFTAGSIKDLAGNWYAGTNSYNFTTESSPIIQGSSGNDTINGGAGNDAINGGAGTDSIDGGAGTDTAAYSASRSNYTTTKTTTGYTVKDATGADGTDTLTNVEQLQFVDHTVNLAQMDRVFKYFVAYYGRAPASTGKDYWLDNLSGTFANDEKQLVWNFGSATQAEFINLYGSGGTVSDFVSKVYSNLFNRTPLQTGLDYWNGIYDAKKAEGKDDNAIRGEMVTWIMDGATDSATNKDLTTLNNKVLAASMFTTAVDTPAELAGYRIASNTAALDYAREWLHEITNDSTTLNSHIDPVALDQTIIQLVGLYEPVG